MSPDLTRDEQAAELGARLRRLRDRSGLTQQEVATATDITRARISHYETGARNMPVHLLVPLADFYGVSLDVLAGRVAEGEDRVSAYAEGWRQGYAAAGDQALRAVKRVLGREERSGSDPTRKPSGGPRLPEKLARSI